MPSGQYQYMHTVCAIIILLALAVSFSTVSSIISISQEDQCDFGCGFKLNTIVLPLLLVSLMALISWGLWAKGKIETKYIGIATVFYIVLWGTLVAYARTNL